MNGKFGRLGDWFFILTFIPISILIESMWGILLALLAGTLINFYRSNTWNVAQQALSATPAESLTEHDNELIERCANVCDEASVPNYDEIQTDAQWAALVLAQHIRALKTEVNNDA